MKRSPYTILLSIIVTLLVATAATGGLLINNLYHDNAFVKLAWYANDLITLFVIVPSLVIAIYYTHKNSERWLMLLMGLLGYVFYNFAFYLFGAVFNIFFLIYSVIVSTSAITLILLIFNCDISNIANKFSENTPVKSVSIYLFLITVMLLGLELSMIIPFLLSGNIPTTIILTGLSTSVVFALDFSIVIPVSLIAAVLLWQRRSWGFVLAIIMLVKGVTYGLVLCVGTALLAYSNTYGKWDPLMPLYFVLFIAGMLGCWLLLKHFKEDEIKM
jgi:hypothetical protein